jgi:hypothetical protein
MQQVSSIESFKNQKPKEKFMSTMATTLPEPNKLP